MFILDVSWRTAGSHQNQQTLRITSTAAESHLLPSPHPPPCCPASTQSCLPSPASAQPLVPAPSSPPSPGESPLHPLSSPPPKARSSALRRAPSAVPESLPPAQDPARPSHSRCTPGCNTSR